ncbi:MAG: hypothetical protein AVDCRST_MAG14-763 [uncultured Rubrobacteraceae bacterium]|uniref:Uncharacterized protein n=1 Tax=uncultured Rubrobacteraceae bacterium TaxID=349277 RepID=A0A6J4QR99_9ACTN|nr:MAG: hypothetical protein AVDCRST_MAG14-763 [uncultured Rubrobacteraceae bacterium]
MNAYQLGITIEGNGLHAATHRVREPAVQILAELLVVRVEDEPAVPVRHRLRELLRDLASCIFP